MIHLSSLREEPFQSESVTQQPVGIQIVRVLRDLASADSIGDSGCERRLPESAQRYGYLETRNYLSLFKDTWVDNADNDQTGNDQSKSDKGDEEDAASAGRKFTPYDPILLSYISVCPLMAPASPRKVANIPGSQSTSSHQRAKPRSRFLGR